MDTPKNELRQRLREMLSVPERERTDAQWDEIIELEIRLAPGNQIDPNRNNDHLGSTGGQNFRPRQPQHNKPQQQGQPRKQQGRRPNRGNQQRSGGGNQGGGGNTGGNTGGGAGGSGGGNPPPSAQ